VDAFTGVETPGDCVEPAYCIAAGNSSFAGYVAASVQGAAARQLTAINSVQFVSKVVMACILYFRRPSGPHLRQPERRVIIVAFNILPVA